MTKYANSKIYKIEPIVEHNDDDIYIGSTTQKYLSDRMSSHRSHYKLWKDGKKGKITVFDLFDKYGVENCNIYLIVNFPCESKNELTAREGYYIKANKCLNKNIAGRTRKEYREDNKEKIKQYRVDNKDKIIEKLKQYRVDNKDKIIEKNKQYRVDNKDKIIKKNKQYRVDNKDKIIKKNKQHRVDNRDKIKAKCVCECGGKYTNANKARHIKSKKHQNYSNNL